MQKVSEEEWTITAGELSNALLCAQTLTASFKKPWNLLAETNLAVRSTVDFSATNSNWWSLLDKARTFFDENPS